VALLLVGAIALVPWISARVFAMPLPLVPGALALAQLRAASPQPAPDSAIVTAVG
jgi:hypothetical protein